MQHVWTYQPLVGDVLAMRLNRINIMARAARGRLACLAPPWQHPPPGRSGIHTSPGCAPQGPATATAPGGKKSFELDTETDPFWDQHQTAQFPKVAEEVESELTKYKAAVANVTSKTQVTPEDVGVQSTDVRGGAPDPACGARGQRGEAGARLTGGASRPSVQGLMKAVSSLPELTERKRIIDKHTNIATALLNQIKVGAGASHLRFSLSFIITHVHLCAHLLTHAFAARLQARSLDSYYVLEEELLTAKAVRGRRRLTRRRDCVRGICSEPRPLAFFAGPRGCCGAHEPHCEGVGGGQAQIGNHPGESMRMTKSFQRSPESQGW